MPYYFEIDSNNYSVNSTTNEDTGKSTELSQLFGGVWIESENNITIGSLYNSETNTWSTVEQPDPEPIYEYKKYQAGQWMQTLTTPELDAIYTMRSTTPSIDRMIDYVKLNGIDFNKETHRLEMHNLKAAGVFDSDRVDELLGYHQIN
jgi:hypothetical protein